MFAKHLKVKELREKLTSKKKELASVAELVSKVKSKNNLLLEMDAIKQQIEVLSQSR